MRIEFYYFEDCPSYNAALHNLHEALAESNTDADVEKIRIDSVDDAKRLNFQGSPSIRFDGVDIEGESSGYSYNCRLYEVEGKLSGIPSKQLFVNAIAHFTE